MKNTAAWLFVIFVSLIWALSANAQGRPNRDSAEYYFQRGANFYEDHSGKAPTARMAVLRRMAMSDYSKSIAFDSSYYWSYRNRGYCHENFGEYELALADYNQAVLTGKRRGEADAVDVHVNCVNMCIRLQKWAEAEAHCTALLTNLNFCPRTGDTSCRSLWLQRAEARTNQKKYLEAKQDYLIYQQQTAFELSAAQQKLALVTVKEKTQHLSKRERASRAARGESPKKQLTPVEKLVRENREVSAKLAELEKLMTQ